MKKLLFIALYLFLFTAVSLAQNKEEIVTRGTVNQGYYEFNFGAALIDDLSIPFPGISFLIGNRTYFKNSVILDAEIGLALPSIGTAKLGVGYKMGASEIIIGLRPWPLHYYLQTQLSRSEKGGWIMSVEVSSFAFNRSYNDAAYNASMASLGMINFGYRWERRKK